MSDSDTPTIWVRVIGPNDDVLEEGPIERGIPMLEFQKTVARRHRQRPLIIEQRDGEWVEHSRIEH